MMTFVLELRSRVLHCAVVPDGVFSTEEEAQRWCVSS